jgi:hypothetical protein
MVPKSRMKLSVIQVVLVVSVVWCFSDCWGTRSERYVLQRTTLSAARFHGSSENYFLRGSLGQATPVGAAASESYDHWAGFYNRFWESGLLRGDFDSDGDVDLFDFSVLGSAWRTKPGDLNWNPNCDISDLDNDFIDELDLAVYVDYYLVGVIIY